ncbi:uncharacterized protein N7469_002581 [Penicillium citrinum]|uniref:Uncharacterized protein n=1 Tax=Penicillium citrinum TaxID=5077 RepID=A0A9W9PAV4_PENCI|nr:uncharacterized protein N7469_002581 [Penicillium citrinum]KAJ5240990.1 hypothetical protein N7469_002581 [Penicillium citrinum]
MVKFSKPSATHLAGHEIPLYAEPDCLSDTATIFPDDRNQEQNITVQGTGAHIKSNLTKFSTSNYPSQGMSAAVWICCQSNDVNTFALAPERCSVCGHFKCLYCS